MANIQYYHFAVIRIVALDTIQAALHQLDYLAFCIRTAGLWSSGLVQS